MHAGSAGRSTLPSGPHPRRAPATPLAGRDRGRRTTLHVRGCRKMGRVLGPPLDPQTATSRASQRRLAASLAATTERPLPVRPLKCIPNRRPRRNPPVRPDPTSQSPGHKRVAQAPRRRGRRGGWSRSHGIDLDSRLVWVTAGARRRPFCDTLGRQTARTQARRTARGYDNAKPIVITNAPMFHSPWTTTAAHRLPVHT